MKASLIRTGVAVGSAAAAVSLAIAANRRREVMNLSGKVVLITGGSHGLGLALARGFAAKASRLVLCARNEDQLSVAREDLARRGAQVFTVPCDVANRTDVDRLISRTLERFGAIDVLVNNAGIIQTGPFHTMTLEDFETAMNIMFWGPVHTTFAALPYLQTRGEARIVNITSVGAKVSVPHLIPYSCAKFACVAFSEGMRAELQTTGVKVVTIAPGLMRTGSHLNAVFKGAEKGEAVWFSICASLPGVSMNAERAAGQIISATERGTAERILSLPANLLARFHGLFPGTTSDLLGIVNRALPNGSQQTERGAESRVLEKSWMRALTLLGRRAAVDLLQPSAARIIHS
jgi:NAD(P)-dependent dehydrogenase (short-subunit alcohol dehydrogenase family)